MNRRSTIRKLAIGAAAGMAAAGILVFQGIPATQPLSARADDEIKSSGRVVTTVSTTNAAGSPVREIKYFVLDLRAESPNEAVNSAVRALLEAGWVDPKRDGDSQILHSEASSAVVVVESLASFFRQSQRMGFSDSEAARDIKKKVSSPANLVLATAEPRVVT